MPLPKSPSVPVKQVVPLPLAEVVPELHAPEVNAKEIAGAVGPTGNVLR